MLLKIEHLSKNYQNIPAVQNVSFETAQGELVTLLGPSGCGKSTILHMIGGFITPTEGKIILHDKDITRLEPEKRNIATVFQNYGLFSNMNVIDNVSYGLKIRHIAKSERYERARHFIAQVGLSGLEKRPIAQLSGGQQQRVALARSLIMEPQLLLLDEPLSNLDQKLRLKLRQEIRDLQKRLNITTLFVTHDQEEAFAISDKIILLHEGQVQQIGTAYDLYNHPANTFAQEFIGQSHLHHGRRYRGEDFYEDPSGEPHRIKDIVFKGPTLDLILEDRNSLIVMTVLNRKKYCIGDVVKVLTTKKTS